MQIKRTTIGFMPNQACTSPMMPASAQYMTGTCLQRCVTGVHSCTIPYKYHNASTTPYNFFFMS